MLATVQSKFYIGKKDHKTGIVYQNEKVIFKITKLQVCEGAIRLFSQNAYYKNSLIFQDSIYIK